MSTPFSFRAAAISRVTRGDTVLMSMTVAPSSTPAITPFSPRMTASTSGVSVTMVMTTWLPRAASFGVSTRSPPPSTTSWTRGRSLRL